MACGNRVGQSVGSFVQDGTDWSASVGHAGFCGFWISAVPDGVVYQDNNGDSRYGLGEGLGNWR